MKKWIIASVAALFTLFLTQVTQIHWVKSKSLGDHNLYLTIKGLSVNPGNIVTFYHTTEHLGRAYYTKELVAKEGEKIAKLKDMIFVASYPFLLKKDFKKDGITYTLRSLKEKVIPQGHIFVRGTHEYSYDSRYEGFGLVPTSSVVGRSFVLL